MKAQVLKATFSTILCVDLSLYMYGALKRVPGIY